MIYLSDTPWTLIPQFSDQHVFVISIFVSPMMKELNLPDVSQLNPSPHYRVCGRIPTHCQHHHHCHQTSIQVWWYIIKQVYKYDEWYIIIIITIMDLTEQRNAKIWRALPTITSALIWKCLLLFITRPWFKFHPRPWWEKTSNC